MNYNKLINTTSKKLRQKNYHQFKKNTTFNNQIKPKKYIKKITLK